MYKGIKNRDEQFGRSIKISGKQEIRIAVILHNMKGINSLQVLNRTKSQH